MKTISLNTDRVLIGSSNITYYGESLKTFGVTGNPKIFELDKDKFNLNIYGSMNFTGSGRINLNGSTINLNGSNVHLTGNNISLDGNISLNGSQNFNISAYTGGTVKIDNYQSNITLSGQKIDIESEIINLSGSEINIESDYLHIHKTGSDVEFKPYTGKSLILHGNPIVLNGSIEVKNSMNVSGLFSINGNNGSLQFREFSKIDCVSTDGNKEFIFGAQGSCFIEGNDSYIGIVAGYVTGYTGSINIFSRDGDIKLNGSSIILSGTSINLSGSRVDLSGSVYLNGSLLLNGGGSGDIGSIWSGYNTMSILSTTGGTINLNNQAGKQISISNNGINLNGSQIYLSGSRIDLSGNVYLNGNLLKNGIGSEWNGYTTMTIETYTGGTINLFGSNILLSGSNLSVNTPNLKIENIGTDTHINWYTGQTLVLEGQYLNINGSISFLNNTTITGSDIRINSDNNGNFDILNYKNIDIKATGSDSYTAFGVKDNCFVEARPNAINIVAGYMTGYTGNLNMLARSGNVSITGNAINLNGSLTITVGGETYLFSGGSFVLQS